MRRRAALGWLLTVPSALGVAPMVWLTSSSTEGAGTLTVSSNYPEQHGKVLSVVNSVASFNATFVVSISMVPNTATLAQVPLNPDSLTASLLGL